MTGLLEALKVAVRGKRDSVWGRSYKGLPIKSDYRAHDAAFELVRQRFSDVKTLKVLDIATGTGAFAQRMTDAFSEWRIEINDFEGQSMIPGSRRYALDLNADFAGNFDGGYDLITAIEILEHLENPWHFLRETRKMLAKGGVLVLSTPNVDSTLDRLCYLVEGHPLYFGERGFENSGGHITPVPDWLFRKAAAAGGYSSVELCGDVDNEPHTGPSALVKGLLLAPFSRLFMRGRNDRSINVYRCG